ncbi:MAG: helix-turn-helix domain-containing protein [Gammaproteobacteria bacterium]|nr:helix-turn-helix domain-containing protein [Rhodocyclaceae bacterium]MBU3908748.1 helix-turn-helix domain-containing protein [Gammaproteobacteria bacterium]MBU3989198.1 helix-turn-helix domain-containing protein [Gammaproteobacteria bacterium]MBU4004776.1 helix-turn-helix domain-containing protein [Gammaproteobacteria bacterium]MBU4021379.1 helix-turn-helix domain-containing protein [Gammaproteobacteria bacterium]
MELNSSTLAVLQAIYPGAFLLDTQQVAQILGLSPKTVRNLGGKFAVPSIKIGDSRRYKIIDVAAVIDTGTVLPPQAAQPPTQRGRGRPRKVAGGVQ